MEVEGVSGFNNTIKIPWELFIGSTSTYGAIILLSLIVVWVYVVRYGHAAYTDVGPRFISILTCVLVLISVLLLPVDVFMTSYQKYSNGTWREWASDNSTRQQINNSVLYTYYTCYTLLTFSIFILLPFSYFFFEEGDADEDVPIAERCCTAFKYSACFIFLVSALLLCGAFIQFGSIPNTNGTTIDDLKYLGDQIKERGVEAALSTTISVCTVMGLFVFILYTAYGLSAFPLDFIKARGSAAKELDKLNCSRIVRDEEERLLVSKYADGRPMIPADRRRMEKLRGDKHRYNELERLLDSERQSCWTKIQIFLRPFSIVLGIALLLLSIAFMSSLGVTLADKFVYSNFTMGYFLSATHYHYNPMNFILTEAQHIFPIDYVLICLLVFYVAACTVNGIRRIGIWFFWVKVFEVVPHRTMPQGLLILSGLFSCAMVALNQVVLVALPTYATYGSQHYRNGTTGNVTVVPCDNHAPPGECQLTQFASIIARFTLHANFYGAIVTYLIAAFVVVYLVGFIVALFRRKRNVLEKVIGTQSAADDDPLLNI